VADGFLPNLTNCREKPCLGTLYRTTANEPKTMPSALILLCTIIISIGIAAPASAGAAPFMPGAWEITHTRSGGPGDAAPEVSRTCFTAADLQSDPYAPLKRQPVRRNGERAPTCAIATVRIADGKVDMQGNCKGPFGARKIQWTGSQSAERFDLTGRISFGFMSARMIISGRHAGACVAQ
jgi:Protein of unknown function (DUF3617)